MLSESGFIRPTYQELLADRITKAKELFGEDIETSELTALGKFIRLDVYDLATAYEVLEDVYYARFPHTARGVSLDRLCVFVGISRNPPTYALHTVKFTGTAGHEIETGFLVSDSSENVFHTLGVATIGEDGTCEAQVESNEPGEIGNVALGSIDTIVNPDMDVLTVEHIAIDTIATDAESDVELRARFEDTIAGSGSGTAESIRAAIMRVRNVSGCVIIENDSAETDSDGRPPNSFECFVTAPEDVYPEIAEAIFQKKPLGIKAVGDMAVEITDESGIAREVRFSVAEQIVVYFNIEIKVSNRFGADGTALIRERIAERVNNLQNGDDLILTSLYADIYGVEGVEKVSVLQVSTNGTTYNSDDVNATPSQAVRVSESNIKVVVSEYVDK